MCCSSDGCLHAASSRINLTSLYHPSSLTHLTPVHILIQASPNATVDISRQRGPLQLFVRISADRTVTLDVLASASITSVRSKALTRFKEGAGQYCHALFFGGTPLEPGSSLSDYNVFNHATLELLSLLIGGMDTAPANQATPYHPGPD